MVFEIYCLGEERMMQMNENKICFIICTNDEFQLNECLMYLELLEVPEGVEVEILAISDAKSMTAGYNEGMNASDAKYKVYLHQDSFIIERKFIEKVLKIFRSDKKIGMIGMIGSERLSKDGIMWHGKRCGNFYHLEEIVKEGECSVTLLKRGKREVDVIDGFLMVTQYDIPWREDIFTGWDFYDVSQCLEFKRAGYKIIVPGQQTNWVIHACGAPAFWNYNRNREILLKHYPEVYEGKEEIRILFVHSEQIVMMGLPYTLTQMGYSVDISTHFVTIFADYPHEVEWIEEELEEGLYDLVMTYDLVPSVSKACENYKVKYLAWVYDSPLLETYRKEAMNKYTYISVFDKKQFERLEELERISHLYYVPLATEVDVFGTVSIKKKDEKKYKADVAFVGRLYDGRGYDKLFSAEDAELHREADTLIEECGCVWDGENDIFGKASDKLIDHISSKIEQEIWDLFDIDKRYYCESMKLVRRCNEIERVKVLNRLAAKHQVVLYADKVVSTELNKNVEIRPWVDYWSEMPKVFYLSKININITSRSIESGIPQRVWDIMAVGGFCLTNYQPELEDYFEIGKDLEVYHNLEELEQKVEYYLKHEEQRIRIAINGYKKVRGRHDYKSRLVPLLDKVFAV